MENEKLVLDNMGLAGHIAKKYLNTGYEYEDLVQEGFVGLVRAAECFDPDGNCRFSTWASVCIENSIRMYLRRQKRHRRCVLSLDQEVCEDGSRLEELIGIQEDAFEGVWKQDLLVRAIGAITSEEQEMVRMYYFDGMSQRDIARRYGCGQMTVHRRLKRILAKMRRAVE